ncbi:MAG: DUF2493 domain-containing protein [Phycisphaerales bacterium JB063]
MKTIIAGSRDITDFTLVSQVIDASKFDITGVVCGEARGVDALGKRWANNRSIPVYSFPADWRQYGKAAGPMRNREMAAVASALIVIRYPDSRGSADMLRQAKHYGLRVHDHIVSKDAT